MHRQSLGSPVSKLHFHGGSLPKHNDDDDSCILASSLPPPLLDYDDERLKTAKPSRRFSSSASASASASPSSMPPSPHAATPEKLIHLIPIVVLFCFLILYLVSHNPSQSNSDEMNSIVGELNSLKAKDVLPIRSFRNLQETEEGGNIQKSRSQHHRKFAGL
ncbi:hypothetical protein LINPERPRIM_LOCUS9378 [Linum perenne]